MLKNAAAIGKSPQGTGASQSSVSTYRKSDDPNPYVNVGRNPNPYQIKFALRDSRRLSLDFLQNSIRHLIQADYQIKTGVNPSSKSR